MTGCPGDWVSGDLLSNLIKVSQNYYSFINLYKLGSMCFVVCCYHKLSGCTLHFFRKLFI